MVSMAQSAANWRNTHAHIELRIDYIELKSVYLHSERDGHCFNSFENNRTCVTSMVKIDMCGLE